MAPPKDTPSTPRSPQDRTPGENFGAIISPNSNNTSNNFRQSLAEDENVFTLSGAAAPETLHAASESTVHTNEHPESPIIPATQFQSVDSVGQDESDRLNNESNRIHQNLNESVNNNLSSVSGLNFEVCQTGPDSASNRIGLHYTQEQLVRRPSAYRRFDPVPNIQTESNRTCISCMRTNLRDHIRLCEDTTLCCHTESSIPCEGEDGFQDVHAVLDTGDLIGAVARPGIPARLNREQFEAGCRTCQVCEIRPLDTVLLNCLHMATCCICVRRLTTCPICGQPVLGFQKVR